MSLRPFTFLTREHALDTCGGNGERWTGIDSTLRLGIQALHQSVPFIVSIMPEILLVEDKESLRRVLRLTLEHAGYGVTESADVVAVLKTTVTCPLGLLFTYLPIK